MGFRDPITTADQISSGAFAGTYTVPGLLVVGDPAAQRVEIGVHPADGSPSAGERGVRLYAVDGTTVLIDLNPDGTPTITAATIRTAAAGQRVEIDGADADRVSFYTSNPNVTPGRLRSAMTSAGLPGEQPWVTLESPAEPGRLNAGVQVLGELANSAGTSQINLFAAKIVAGGVFENFAGNPYPEWATDTTQRSFDAGSPTVTTDASGNVTVPHNVGAVPISVIVTTGLSATALIAETGSFTSTNFVLRLKTDAGAAFTGTLVIHYLAVG